MEVLIVPDHPAESEFEDRKSVFLGHLLPVESEEEAKDFVEKMKKRYGDARHNVWAYRLTDGNFRSSDDGEPSGTGGAPVLDAMVKRGISGCVIVVTRYFGGILLGTGGLVHAYSSAASEALNRAGKAGIYTYVSYTLALDYTQYGRLSRLLEKAGCKEIRPEFAEEVTVKFRVPEEEEEALCREIREAFCGARIPERKGRVYIKSSLPAG